MLRKKSLRYLFHGSGRERMIDIVLVEPEIPHNTGAIARTCAATGARLHLIHPLGFDISDKMVKRCGLDYWYLVEIHEYQSIDEYFAKNGDTNIYLATTKAPRSYHQVDMSGDVALLFGKETKGLPESLRYADYDRAVRLAMIGQLRSLNLANSVAIALYEALRRHDFFGKDVKIEK